LDDQLQDPESAIFDITASRDAARQVPIIGKKRTTYPEKIWDMLGGGE